MQEDLSNPFDSLDSTYEYIRLLQDALKEALDSIGSEAVAAQRDGADRRLQALQIVTYKLHLLDDHMAASRRLVKDLRTLRRVLLGEGGSPHPATSADTRAGDGRSTADGGLQPSPSRKEASRLA